MADLKSTHLSKAYLEASEGSVLEEQLFYVDRAHPSKTDLCIVWGGFERCAPDFEIKREHHPYYVIEYPTKGRCHLEINGKPYLLKKNHIGGFSTNCKHHYLVDKHAPMEHLFIAFTGSQAADLFNRSTLAEKGVIEVSNLSDIDFLMQSIIRKGLVTSTETNNLCNHYLRLLLLELAEQVPRTQNASQSLSTYLECKRFIEENFSWISSASTVAGECKITTRHLTRLFNQYGEYTPHDYILRLKINKACVLLVSSEEPIKEIALRVGYEDPYHFSRNFKKIMKTSPKIFRQQ